MLYLFHGPDAFSRAEAIAQLKSQIGDEAVRDFNTTLLDGRQASLSEIIHACDSVPFLAERRLVVVEGLLSRLPASPEESGPLAELIAYLKRLPPSTDLVLSEDEPVAPEHPIHRLAANNPWARVRNFPELQGPELEKWAAERARSKGLSIPRRVLGELLLYVGNNLYLLDAELNKLATFAAGQPLSMADLHRLVSYTREESIFSLVDHLGQRNGPAALKQIHQLLDDGHDPLYILSMIARQFRLILLAKDLSQSGKSAAEIMAALEIKHKFLLEKVQEQAKNFSLPWLQRIYRQLGDIDLQIKTGQIEPQLALDLLVAEICQPSDRARQARHPTAAKK